MIFGFRISENSPEELMNGNDEVDANLLVFGELGLYDDLIDEVVVDILGIKDAASRFGEYDINVFPAAVLRDTGCDTTAVVIVLDEVSVGVPGREPSTFHHAKRKMLDLTVAAVTKALENSPSTTKVLVSAIIKGDAPIPGDPQDGRADTSSCYLESNVVEVCGGKAVEAEADEVTGDDEAEPDGDPADADVTASANA